MSGAPTGGGVLRWELARAPIQYTIYYETGAYVDDAPGSSGKQRCRNPQYYSVVTW